jgi:hypothetical protein
VTWEAYKSNVDPDTDYRRKWENNSIYMYVKPRLLPSTSLETGYYGLMVSSNISFIHYTTMAIGNGIDPRQSVFLFWA